ncbi:MAG TPA: hypothetical protein VEC19_14810 [Usitatibacter sp.]|nr:hypothetical protein [Usitatibacter sp.]
MSSQADILEAFREAASGGGTLVARRRGDAWEVRRVEAALPGGGASSENTARVFTDGLRQFFGEPIVREVSRQVGLRPDSAEALDARAVLAALDMASESRAAFAGLNFISRQAISARGLSPQFRLVCLALGILPEKIPQPVLRRADEIFARSFEARADGDRRSVDLIEARLVMADSLAEALREE